MNYLKNYNITDSEIENIKNVLEEKKVNIDLFIFDPEKIIDILNIFLSYGITNLYEIIITSPSLFCDTIKSIKIRLENYPDKNELAKLINEDAKNLLIVDLL